MDQSSRDYQARETLSELIGEENYWNKNQEFGALKWTLPPTRYVTLEASHSPILDLSLLVYGMRELDLIRDYQLKYLKDPADSLMGRPSSVRIAVKWKMHALPKGHVLFISS